MFNSNQITADFTTLYHQASDTAEGYLARAIRSIDEALGAGYAAKHPELIAAFISSATADCNTAVHAKVYGAAIREVAEALNQISGALDRISDSMDNISSAIESD